MVAGNRGGRPPKPTALKIVQGTARPDRVKADEPKPPAAATDVPAWAGLTGEALAAWERLAPELSRMGVLTTADVAALVQLCRRYGDYMRLAEHVAVHGETFEERRFNKDGDCISETEKARPQVVMRDRAWQDYQRGLGEFGLNPSARTRVSAAPQQEKTDPFEDLMSKTRRQA